MCDGVFDDEDVGNLMDIKVKEFERINSGIEQTAFRDGFLESKETHVQRGFEDGFKESYQNHSSVNLVKGFIIVLLSSGMINNSSPVLPSLIRLKEDLDQLEERLTSVHESVIESKGCGVIESKGDEVNESSHSGDEGTGSRGVSDMGTELIQSFNGMKERLKSVCDAIQLPLSEDVLNCEISFSHGKVTSRSVTQTDAEEGQNS